MSSFYKNFSLNNISAFLLVIFPISLITGPLLSEISMNLISIIFLFKIYKQKNTKLFSETFFIFFMLFYFIIILTVFLSNYLEILFFKNIFYFRYIFFVFAVAHILNESKNLFLIIYKYLCIVFLILSVDGLIQFFLDYNIFGNPKVRPDRVSGFFGDKMILGSYLSRIMPLLVSLFLYNIKSLSKNEKIYGILVILLSFVGIFISGERMPLISIIFYFISITIFLNIEKKIKFTFFATFLAIFMFTLLVSPTLFDRHIKQTIDQVNLNFNNKNFFSNFQFYERTYETAFNGFLDRKITGQGAKSFRFFCAEKKFINKLKNIHVGYNLGSLLDEGNVYIEKIYFNDGDLVKWDDKVFEYIKGRTLSSDASKEKEIITWGYDINATKKSFIIDRVYFPKEFYFSRLKLPPRSIQTTGKPINLSGVMFNYKYIKSGCTTHPHNFYLQLLAETGLVGFIFVFSLFIYLVFLICKNFIGSFLNKKTLTNFQISLLIGFIMTLLPLIPNGNFFNNWICMIMFYPVGFFINSLRVKNK